MKATGGAKHTTVLVADDSAASRELIRTILERDAYNVVEAVDGCEALRKAREIQPDLILLDIQMPSLDGFGVIGMLRADPMFAATPVVAITASAMHGDRERALAAGFTSYITKPVRLAVLRTELARLLG